MIIRKLEYFREGKSEKHLNDIKSILEISGEQIDQKQIKERISEYGLEKEWEKIFI